MHWILQENLFKESEWEKLVSTLDRFKIPYSIHKVIPFIGELLPPAEPTQEKVICFGSYSMRHTAKANNWSPGVYDLFDLNFLVQYMHWGQKLLNADALVMKFRHAEIYEPTFIRPVDDSKYFAGRVFDPEEFNIWRHGVCEMGEDYGTSLTGDTMIQLCKPKTIYAEYRYWIVDGQIVTKSLYKRGSRVIYSPDVDPKIDNFVQSCIWDEAPATCLKYPAAWLPKAFVIDVCETPNGYKIVEINTINSAGFYAGDVQKLIMALEEMEARPSNINITNY